ncbi:MAG: sirohydrochlorin cobaltochelatase [Clostridia bacterium]|nr:sirohydrochlorin cobaltochelatase [Clostridia bacterium]
MKQAMIAVSFGTTHADAERDCIVPVEEALRAAFPDWTVARAWTSRRIAQKLNARGAHIENEIEALARLQSEGYEKLALIPTHIIRGNEYEMVERAAGGVPVSAPLIDTEADIEWMSDLLDGIAQREGRVLLAMGHGTDHPANAIYRRLAERLTDRARLACVEGDYTLDETLNALMQQGERKVTLMPLMLVAGDHAKVDMAGDQQDSWKSRLTAKGFDVALRLQGLGALEAVQSRFVEKARAALQL